MTSVETRQQLVDALRLDLVGPGDGLGTPDEALSQLPSRWYLTGFLVPLDAEDVQRRDEDSTDEIDELSDSSGMDDAATPEPAAARQTYLPSSIGLSLLVPHGTSRLSVTARWGDYRKLSLADCPFAEQSRGDGNGYWASLNSSSRAGGAAAIDTLLLWGTRLGKRSSDF
jgi:hypothetical protein